MLAPQVTRIRVPIIIGLVCGAAFAVYPSFVQLDMTDPVTRRTFRAVSAEDYRLALDGRAPFPYQWRMLGPWVVRAGERATGADPHAIDAGVKVAALSLSAAALGLFAASIAGPALGCASVGFYLAASAGAFASQGYSIYYTSDYLMIAAWFWAVYAMARRKFAAAALIVFAGAWAKETMIVAPMCAALLWRRGGADARDLALIAAAFAIPTVALRLIYAAPLAAWAWWGSLYRNVPFLDPRPSALAIALRDNAKVLLFYNAGWWLAARGAWRSRNPMVRDLALTLLIYLALAYVVVYIRELRHMLPLAILVIPVALSELLPGQRTTGFFGSFDQSCHDPT